MTKERIGIIGGSGLYDLLSLSDKNEVHVDTPFGSPSDSFLCGVVNNRDIVFLPRHGRGHTLLPSEINYRANIYGMKTLGVTSIISVSAVGSMRKDIMPTHIVVCDQFLDRTKNRESTFFGKGIVAHVSFADPLCRHIREVLYNAGIESDAAVHNGGTYLCMEGPHFSTKAESNTYRQWGVDVIGMTNLTEAKLAREAELCYATLALATDYDCWYEEEESVTADAVIEVMKKNIITAQKIIECAIPNIPYSLDCTCRNALKNTIMTNRESIPNDTLKKLEPIIGKYMR